MAWDFTLQANKLTWYSFMNTDRRHKTPGSEIKDYYWQKWQKQSVGIFLDQFPNLQFPKVLQRGPDDTCIHPGLYFGKITEL